MMPFLSAVGWLICSVVAGLAVFSPTIKDTLLERIGLAGISITALGVAYRAVTFGELAPGGVPLGVAIGLYSIAVLLKHLNAIYKHERHITS